MNDKEYIEQRVDDQINWYSKRSSDNQKYYKNWRMIEIVCAASIPFLVAYVGDDSVYLKLFVGLLGVCVAVSAGAVALYKFQENWIKYRTTGESLKHERFLYLTQAELYGSEERFSLFVQRIESIVSKENSGWSQYTGVSERHE